MSCKTSEMKNGRSRFIFAILSITIPAWSGILAASTTAFAEEAHRPTNANQILAAVDNKGGRLPLERAALDSSATIESLDRQIRESLSAYRISAEPQLLMAGRLNLRVLEQKAPGAKETLFLKAVFLQQEHKFDAAIAILDRVVKEHPDFFEARVLKAGIHLVQGDLERAMRDCKGLLQYGDELLTYACSAAASSTNETLPKNVSLLEALITSNRERVNDGVWLWANSITADLADRNGEPERAEKLLKAEHTAASTKSILSLVQLADVLLEQKKFEETEKLLENYPEIDALLLRRVIALRELNDSRAAQLSELLGERMATFEASDAKQHARELALYYLSVVKDSQKALRFAAESFSYQKETIDYRNLFLAALKASDTRAIDQVTTEATQRQYADKVFWGLRK